MAVLDNIQKAKLRRSLARRELVTWNSPVIDAASQAIEDYFEAHKAEIATDIDTATSPFVFSNQQKKLLVGFWLLDKFGRETL